MNKNSIWLGVSLACLMGQTAWAGEQINISQSTHFKIDVDQYQAFPNSRATATSFPYYHSEAVDIDIQNSTGTASAPNIIDIDQRISNADQSASAEVKIFNAKQGNSIILKQAILDGTEQGAALKVEAIIDRAGESNKIEILQRDHATDAGIKAREIFSVDAKIGTLTGGDLRFTTDNEILVRQERLFTRYGDPIYHNYTNGIKVAQAPSTTIVNNIDGAFVVVKATQTDLTNPYLFVDALHGFRSNYALTQKNGELNYLYLDTEVVNRTNLTALQTGDENWLEGDLERVADSTITISQHDGYNKLDLDLARLNNFNGTFGQHGQAKMAATIKNSNDFTLSASQRSGGTASFTIDGANNSKATLTQGGLSYSSLNNF